MLNIRTPDPNQAKKVFDDADPDRHGKVINRGPEVSAVCFDDGAERNVPNVHLRSVDELDQSSSKSEEPEQAAIREGREAWRRVCTSWNDWKKVGAAFVIGRTTAMRDAHTNVPKGRGYNAALRAWQKKHGFEGLDDTGDQTRLFRCMENLVAIERWLVQRSEIERSRLNHPSTIWRRWQASLKPSVSDDEKKPSHVQKLNNSIAALQEENNRMRREIERGGGDLWNSDDRPRDIARIVIQQCKSKTKAEKVAREILAALKEG